MFMSLSKNKLIHAFVAIKDLHTYIHLSIAINSCTGIIYVRASVDKRHIVLRGLLRLIALMNVTCSLGHVI